MKSYPKKYNKLFKVIESKKFKEFFEVATFRKRLSNKIHKTITNQHRKLYIILEIYSEIPENTTVYDAIFLNILYIIYFWLFGKHILQVSKGKS